MLGCAPLSDADDDDRAEPPSTAHHERGAARLPTSDAPLPEARTTESPSAARWVRHVAAGGAAGVVLACVDAPSGALRDGDLDFALAFRLLAYVLPWFLLAGAACGAAALAASLLVRAARDEVVDGGPRAAAVVLLATPVVVCVHLVGRWVQARLNNQELGALVVAGATVGLTALATAVFPATCCALRRAALRAPPSRRPLLVWGVAVLVAVAALTWLALRTAVSLRDVGPWPVAGPFVALAVAFGAHALLVRRAWRARSVAFGVAGSFCAAAALAALVARGPADLPGAIVVAERWSAALVHGVRVTTDVDGDGFSSWLGGGDCAPFDGTVNPAAPDVPGNGIDENCLGGDSSGVARATPPVWLDAGSHTGSARHLVVVTVESLRADRVSFLGHERVTTPNLDQLAGQAAVFGRLYSASCTTRLSLASLWSTLLPSEVEWTMGTGKGPRMAPGLPWVPELLQEAGFETIAILPNLPALSHDEDLGFVRGFTTYDTATPVKRRRGKLLGIQAEELVSRALDRLRVVGARRFLLWIHFAEPHASYDRHPGSPDFGPGDAGRYDSEIWGVDRAVHRLVLGLERAGVWDDTVLLVAGDHGEAFGEHGRRHNSTDLHEPQVRVPGLLRLPRHARRRIDGAVAHQDLLPTALNALGVRRGWESLRGRNLLPLWAGHTLDAPAIVLESFRISDFSRYSAALVEWPYKVVYREPSRSLQIFLLETDPGETTDLAAREPNRLETMKAELFQILDARSRRVRPAG